ncbi:MAG: NAD(P)H-hydrate epimerase [Candidatus Omnitrophota bacterium]
MRRISNIENLVSSIEKRESLAVESSLSVEKIRLLEQKAKELGLDERILIENASSSLFRAIRRLNLGRKALVISGKGNNGADVLSCARKLFSRGYKVKAAVLEEKIPNEEVLFQKGVLEKIKLPLYSIKQDNISELKALLRGCDFILEGILGIGVKGILSPFLQEVISVINKSGKKIISCDIPSGLSPDEGKVLGAAIKADWTVTFIAPKKSFFTNKGKDYRGKILVADIGISREILEKI